MKKNKGYIIREFRGMGMWAQGLGLGVGGGGRVFFNFCFWKECVGFASRGLGALNAFLGVGEGGSPGNCLRGAGGSGGVRGWEVSVVFILLSKKSI